VKRKEGRERALPWARKMVNREWEMGRERAFGNDECLILNVELKSGSPLVEERGKRDGLRQG